MALVPSTCLRFSFHLLQLSWQKSFDYLEMENDMLFPLLCLLLKKQPHSLNKTVNPKVTWAHMWTILKRGSEVSRHSLELFLPHQCLTAVPQSQARGSYIIFPTRWIVVSHRVEAHIHWASVTLPREMHAWGQQFTRFKSVNFPPHKKVIHAPECGKATCTEIKLLHSLIARAFEVLLLTTEQEIAWSSHGSTAEVACVPCNDKIAFC